VVPFFIAVFAKSGPLLLCRTQLPVEEEIYSDFYIPKGKVYIEYWGYSDEPKYSARKQRKLEIYHKYNFHLIELTDKEMQNLDDTLPKLLLAFGISTD
jgi:hypothetical protein